MLKTHGGSYPGVGPLAMGMNVYQEPSVFVVIPSMVLAYVLVIVKLTVGEAVVKNQHAVQVQNNA